MMRIILVAALALFVGACGDSGVFSSDSNNDNNLYDFSMVPSGYQKAASSNDMDNMASVARAVKMLDERVARSSAMSELDELTRMEGQNNDGFASPFNGIESDLNSELRKCSIDTITDTVRNATMMTYGFMPDDDDCMFTLGGSYKTTQDSIGPRTQGAPTATTVTESFTLSALPAYTGEIAVVSYSLRSSEFLLPKSERGETSRDERQITLTGVIVYKNGMEVSFGMKRAYGKTSTKVSDRRTDNNTTTDFRAGFVMNEGTVLYQDFYQKLAKEEKATQYKAVNGLKLEDENQN